MPTWEWILIGVVALVAIVAAFVVVSMISFRAKTKRLRQHYGSEYDFSARWQEVQAGFVDNPATAVGVADRLVTEVMRQRGYPVDDFDQRAADISVDHPQIVDNYRAAHGVHLAEQQADTEQQREAFVHYRALFEKLLDTPTDNEASQEASA
jgi:hypothetical protein